MRRLKQVVGVGLAAAGAISSGLVAQEASDRDDQRWVTVQLWLDGSRLQAAPEDTALARALVPSFERSRRTVETFFGALFPEPIEITLVPHRSAFSAVLRAKWGVEDTACWMVATGVADFLVMLSPRIWNDDACEHDPSDAQHVDDIITHELTHVYHGQRNPSGDFDFAGVEDMGWFIEGLAVHVAGQLHRERLATAKEALAHGALPARLRDAWSGRFRYGVSGSLVRFIDERFGRATLIELLPAMGNAAILAALEHTEEQLLAAWRASVKH